MNTVFLYVLRKIITLPLSLECVVRSRWSMTYGKAAIKRWKWNFSWKHHFTTINTKCWHCFTCPAGMLSVASMSRSTVQCLCVECQQTLNAFLCLLNLLRSVFDNACSIIFNSCGLIVTVMVGNQQTCRDKMTHNTLSQTDITAFYSFRLHSCILCFAYAYCALTVTGLSVLGG